MMWIFCRANVGVDAVGVSRELLEKLQVMQSFLSE